MTRVGLGYDSHRFVAGRSLILGGVDIPYAKGLAGHSDADALTHAVIDAILGACGLGDIGSHFPDSDPRYKGASSIALLKHVDGMIRRKFRVVNIDATILSEEPKFGPYKNRMRAALARALRLPPGNVGVKAKTNERMGFVGRKQGLAVMAVALLEGVKQ